MADAEDTAIAVLVWLAGEPELMGRFLALTGLEASNLREAAREPGFLVGVLSFLMNHEPTLMDFCAASGTRPEEVSRAFHALGGAGET
ncbi:MAG: DUF3572 domain-containing protein [Hoeflea sp.]|uniref:DUF3572 domain-containing protein n=1 Tax=Hoeflea sp. TaxID=1940281 RepID=UPI001D5AED95|nr:DUF3572 domain-containing protein [Hoeflea sp.]MBU4530224.1 DUF3572 domain-containing protein [Alphaproteobacteria bacterium]MBU4542448.1 DUF3572 domain-containing protein [Alphaproteobacteria bacterium]MBU4551134.1 DUF3572 domain-containing protein [Alphaproteobacteria bacterium]MBV1723270.1 DUF3572 domain-containing protein [Hoeflea sp.]MBV1760240.1 DUF3572 domain-containing protein [Hoeflea sp.]